MTARLALTPLVVAALVVPATPATAAPRADARQFGEAAVRARQAFTLVRADVLGRAEAVLRTCGAVLDGPDPPETVRRRAIIIAQLELAEAYDPILPAVRRFVADLEAVRTRDPLLRTARAAYRANLADSARLPRVEDGCGQLRRWREAGWSEAAAPAIPPGAAAVQDHSAELRRTRRIRRGARRMVQLGVRRSRARLFAGGFVRDFIPPSARPAPERR